MDENSVGFRTWVVYPPDREGRVAQLTISHDSVVDIPAEIFRDGDTTMVTLFSRSDGVAWEFPLREFLAALIAAADVVEAPAPGI